MRTQRRSAESSLNNRKIVAQPISFLASSFEFRVKPPGNAATDTNVYVTLSWGELR